MVAIDTRREAMMLLVSNAIYYSRVDGGILKEFKDSKQTDPALYAIQSKLMKGAGDLLHSSSPLNLTLIEASFCLNTIRHLAADKKKYRRDATLHREYVKTAEELEAVLNK